MRRPPLAAWRWPNAVGGDCVCVLCSEIGDCVMRLGIEESCECLCKVTVYCENGNCDLCVRRVCGCLL